MIPIGAYAKDPVTGQDANLNDVSSVQVPIIADIGGKPIPHLFIGGYLGIGVGGAGGRFADACDRANATCVSASFMVGVQAQVNFIPGGKVNPWAGYGIGLQSFAVSGQANGQKNSAALAGVEYARLMGGVDFRLNKTIGIGPMIDLAIGSYSTATVEVNNVSVSGDIRSEARTTHMWLLIGPRFVFFP